LNKKLLIAIIGIVLALPIITISTLYHSFGNSGLIAKGVYIDEVYVGGMDKNAAANAVDDKYSIGQIELAHGDKTYKLTPSELGFKIDTEKSVGKAYLYGRESVMEYVSSITGKSMHIKLNSEYSPELVAGAVEGVSNDIDYSPKDATIRISGGKPSFTKDSDGLEVEKEKLTGMIESILRYESGEKAIQIPTKVLSASVKYDQIKGISTVLAGYSTKYNASNAERSENLRVASRSVSGHVVMPGEVFSLNAVTGKRSVQNGYKMAPIIVKGKLEDGLGGGVCQVSTTLYNAVIRTGLEVVERRNHSIPSSYADLGLDATVSYGSIDFKFKNTLENPVYISIAPAGGTISAQIYGYPEDKRSVKIETQLVEKIERGVETKYDSQLEEGRQRIEDSGRDGFKVKVYRTFMDGSGKKQQLSSDYYPPAKKVVVIGTKKAETTESQKQAETAEEQANS